LIGDNSPMEQHMTGRLTATRLNSSGTTIVEAPQPDEDLFLYVTDGTGDVSFNGSSVRLGQYDVILARPDMDSVTISSAQSGGLDYLSFYLPRFLS
jgi:hypothetical protein